MPLKLNLPNKITLARIFVLPILVVLLITESKIASISASAIFILASITDWLDGHIARSTNQITTIGKLIDPIADKLMILAALIPLVELNRVPAWMAVVILGREFAVSGLRSIAISEGIVIAASNLGKYKTICEMIAITFLILGFNTNFKIIGIIILSIAMCLSILSGTLYFSDFNHKRKL